MVANGFSPGEVLAVIPIPPGIDVCEFIRKISAENDGIQIEQRELERLTLIAPAGSKASARNLHVLVQIGKWTEKMDAESRTTPIRSSSCRTGERSVRMRRGCRENG